MAEQNGDDSQALDLKFTEMEAPGQVGPTDSSSRVCSHVTEPRFNDSARLGHSSFWCQSSTLKEVTGTGGCIAAGN